MFKTELCCEGFNTQWNRTGCTGWVSQRVGTATPWQRFTTSASRWEQCEPKRTHGERPFALAKNHFWKQKYCFYIMRMDTTGAKVQRWICQVLPLLSTATCESICNTTYFLFRSAKTYISFNGFAYNISRMITGATSRRFFAQALTVVQWITESADGRATCSAPEIVELQCLEYHRERLRVTPLVACSLAVGVCWLCLPNMNFFWSPNLSGSAL